MQQEYLPIDCPSCGQKVTGKFCANCGEKRIDKLDFSISHFLAEAVDIFTHFDSKFFKSIALIVAKPGQLSDAYLSGKRKPYMKPLQLFLIVNVIYFLAISYLWSFNTFTTPLHIHLHDNNFYAEWANQKVTERLAKTGLSFERYAIDFDKEVAVFSKTLIVLIIPIIALCFYILYFRKRKFFVEHLVTATHFFTFFLLMNILIMPLFLFIVQEIITTFSPHTELLNDFYATTFVQLMMLWYLTKMFLKVYKVKMWYALSASVLISFAFFNIVWLYRFILFVVGIHTV